MSNNKAKYMCCGCLNVYESETKTECPRCGNDHVIKTYNASDGISITSADLYK